MSEPLKCDICGAPATIHLTQIINGNVRKIHLCEKCAAKHDAADLPIIKFAEMLTKKILGEKIGLKSASQQTPEKICPGCGMTNILFEKTQRLGCPQCYETFSRELAEILPKIQGSSQYLDSAGTQKTVANKRSTKKTAKEKSPELSVEQLKELLADAVAHEDYELAAKTRDIIRSREKKKTRRKTVPAKISSPELSKPTGTRKKKGDK